MELKIDLKDMIETIVDITVEHYVDDYETADRQSHKRIVDDDIESMKNALTTKIVSIIKNAKPNNKEKNNGKR